MNKSINKIIYAFIFLLSLTSLQLSACFCCSTVSQQVYIAQEAQNAPQAPNNETPFYNRSRIFNASSPVDRATRLAILQQKAQVNAIRLSAIIHNDDLMTTQSFFSIENIVARKAMRAGIYQTRDMQTIQSNLNLEVLHKNYKILL